MELNYKELKKIEKLSQDNERECLRIEGQIKELNKRLAEAGCNSIDEANAAIQNQVEEIRVLIKEFNEETETFKTKFKDRLENEFDIL